MRFCYLSGLSPRFQGLSRSSWAGCLRITHPFASISVQQAGLLSIDLHVLGTPPAFILSQDQTLHLISSSIVTACRCLSCINLLTFVVSCNVSISCSVFKELPHCPFEQCSMSISSFRFLCQHVFLLFLFFQDVPCGQYNHGRWWPQGSGAGTSVEIEHRFIPHKWKESMRS